MGSFKLDEHLPVQFATDLPPFIRWLIAIDQYLSPNLSLAFPSISTFGPFLSLSLSCFIFDGLLYPR